MFRIFSLCACMFFSVIPAGIPEASPEKPFLFITPDIQKMQWLSRLREIHGASDADRRLIEELSIKTENEWRLQLTERMLEVSGRVCQLKKEDRSDAVLSLKDSLKAENTAWEAELKHHTQRLREGILSVAPALPDPERRIQSLKTYTDLLMDRRHMLTQSWNRLFVRLESGACRNERAVMDALLPKERLTVPVQLSLLYLLEGIPAEMKRRLLSGR